MAVRPSPLGFSAAIHRIALNFLARCPDGFTQHAAATDAMDHHVTARATPNKISWRRTAKESALLVRSNLSSQRPSSNDGGGTLLGSSIHSSFDFFVYSLQSATRSRFNFLSIPYRWRAGGDDDDDEASCLPPLLFATAVALSLWNRNKEKEQLSHERESCVCVPIALHP